MKEIRVLLTGANGQLGQTISHRWSNIPEIRLFQTDVDELDICDPLSVEQAFKQFKPHFCINAAAYTAVDRAETEKHAAFEINGSASGHIARNCARHHTTLLHISTDYVYDSWPTKFLTETAPTLPKSQYGKSKLLGEQLIINTLDTYYIFRISWLYAESGNNFVKTILRLSQTRPEIQVVDDQFGSPTYAGDLAELLDYLILHSNKGPMPPYGIYNFSNSGITSWYGFAAKILELSGKQQFPLKRISTRDFGAAAPRPCNSKMSKKKLLSHFDIRLKKWEISLEECISRMS